MIKFTMHLHHGSYTFVRKDNDEVAVSTADGKNETTGAGGDALTNLQNAVRGFRRITNDDVVTAAEALFIEHPDSVYRRELCCST